MTQNNQTKVITKLAWIFFMVVPTIVSVFLAIQFRAMEDHVYTIERNEQIVCFTPEMCAIQVQGIWYHINGVIDMNETIPDEYLHAVTVEDVFPESTTEE